MTLHSSQADKPKMLLIGASRGIGLAMTSELLSRGWEVTATVRNSHPEAMQDLSARYPHALTIEQLDINDTDQISQLNSRLQHRCYDALFVNAGTANPNQSETIGEVSTEDFIHVMVTNALSPMRVVETCQDRVRANGLIGVMSSGQGSVGDNVKGGREVYRGSKAALNQYMRSYAARQARAHPDRALLLLAPGWIRTALGGEEGAFSLEETLPDIVNVIEHKRGRPGLEYLDRFGKPVTW
ncbi:NAD(P)-dependent dehydrogenase (short-subunit alcohol dehydrogenase family) [Pantoea sp. PA1]|uniref:SDR family NAD(P)-dependent oxidoreductase n=1 Tax=Pantoea TaxID=53335 RepID=UPI0002417833|nr:MULTISPECIES: SDR family oxidoreductase [Pantoea]MCS4493236.1 SDR family oxidoreductase [Pantoea sp. B623]MDC7871295.1 3-oxoacyl-ACP reductase [Pantoea ananatis]MDF7789158.1 SDR family oxidoreductase [Pantoea ananatis]MDH0051588.1 SDR family oxidoreductase [Pantoea ananatis]MDI3416848.1 SDR family oxidoreductase [Pantoea sp. V106_11]